MDTHEEDMAAKRSAWRARVKSLAEQGDWTEVVDMLQSLGGKPYTPSESTKAMTSIFAGFSNPEVEYFAQEFGSSDKLGINQAASVIYRGVPELEECVQLGLVSLSDASVIARLSHKEQTDVLKAGPSVWQKRIAELQTHPTAEEHN